MSESTTKRRSIFSALAACIFLLSATAASAAPLVELRAGSSTPESDQASMSLARFAELVERKSGGEIVVHNFYQSLGAEQQLVQGAQSGSVDIGMITNGNASRFTDAYLVMDLPFLFKKYDDMLDFMNTPLGRGATQAFEKDTGLKHLYMIGFGSGRDIQTRNKQLRTPADIKGLKIRSISTPVDLAIFKAWGANPTPLGWDQTYAALQQGVVDGMQSNISPVWAGKFYEVVKHNVRVNYTASFEEVFISGKKFASLSPKHQQVLLEAAKETEAWIRKYSSDQLATYIADLKAKGMEMYTPTPAEYAQWSSIRERVWEDVAKVQGGKLNLELAKKIYAEQK